MRRKLLAGSLLLGWQLLAVVLGTAGAGDSILGSWPDPSWFVAVLAVLVKPPAWLVSAAVLLAFVLVTWAWSEFIRHEYGVDHG